MHGAYATGAVAAAAKWAVVERSEAARACAAPQLLRPPPHIRLPKRRKVFATATVSRGRVVTPDLHVNCCGGGEQITTVLNSRTACCPRSSFGRLRSAL